MVRMLNMVQNNGSGPASPLEGNKQKVQTETVSDRGLTPINSKAQYTEWRETAICSPPGGKQHHVPMKDVSITLCHSYSMTHIFPLQNDILNVCESFSPGSAIRNDAYANVSQPLTLLNTQMQSVCLYLHLCLDCSPFFWSIGRFFFPPPFLTRRGYAKVRFLFADETWGSSCMWREWVH